MEMQSRGWVSPKAEDEPCVHTLGQQMLIALGVEKNRCPFLLSINLQNCVLLKLKSNKDISRAVNK